MSLVTIALFYSDLRLLGSAESQVLLKGLDKAFTVKTGPVFGFAICITGKVMTHAGFHDRFKEPVAGTHIAEVDDCIIVRINPIEVYVTIEHAVGDGGHFCAGDGFFRTEGVIQITGDPTVGSCQTDSLVAPVASGFLSLHSSIQIKKMHAYCI